MPTWIFGCRRAALACAVEVFVGLGVDRLYPWGDERPWNFVLHDGQHRRVDLHLYELMRNGMVHYGGFETGETFRRPPYWVTD